MNGWQRSWRRLVLAAVIIAVGLALWAGPAYALTVVEAWRVSFDAPSVVSMDPADGSCWFASDGKIIHLDDQGAVLWDQSGSFDAAAVNTGDGSCWATDNTSGQLTHFAADGTQLWQGGSYRFHWANWVRAIDVDPIGGSVWFGDVGPSFSPPSYLIHLTEGGTELWSSSDLLASVFGVSVNTADGSCWASTTYWFLVHWILHFANDGTPLWDGWAYRPLSISVNGSDSSVWYTNGMDPSLFGSVVHIASDGSSLWNGEFKDPHAVAVNPRDGSCWVGDLDEIIYLASDGTELWRGSGYGSSYWTGGGSISVNPRDGSCRVGDTGNGEVIRLDIVGLPEAAFIATPMVGPAPLTVLFENWSLGTPDSHLWEFGDGATSTERSPTHTYVSADTYTVTLTVSNSYGVHTETGSIECRAPQQATRPPGYWFTHPDALFEAFYAITGDQWGSIDLCRGCQLTPDDAMAVFWRARGRRANFAKHILAAMFNDALLKPGPDSAIDNAVSVLCDPFSTKADISAAQAPLVSYNNSGAGLPLVGYHLGPAYPLTAKEMADDGEVVECVSTHD